MIVLTYLKEGIMGGCCSCSKEKMVKVGKETAEFGGALLAAIASGSIEAICKAIVEGLDVIVELAAKPGGASNVAPASKEKATKVTKESVETIQAVIEAIKSKGAVEDVVKSGEQLAEVVAVLIEKPQTSQAASQDITSPTTYPIDDIVVVTGAEGVHAE